MNKTLIEKIESKLDEQIDILTTKGLSKEEKQENISTAMAVVKVAQVIITAEAIVERSRMNRNNAEETRRLNERFGTSKVIDAN